MEPLRCEALTCLSKAIHVNLISVTNADEMDVDGSIVTPTADNCIARTGFHKLKK